MAQNQQLNFKQRLTRIKAMAFDVDGVFTDGTVYLMPGQEFIRGVNIKDGYAVQHAIKQGFPIAIITGGNSAAVKERFRKLWVTDIYLASAHKWDDYEDFRFKYDLTHDDILFMGDDIPDLEIMSHVGIPAAPVDAAHEIKDVAMYVSPLGGGKGCVRDIIEQVMRAQDKWTNEESVKW